jgi:replicative DNA helicase
LQQAAADAVIVEPLKDAAVGVPDDQVGAGYNRARQNVCAAGIQVLELHHLRKAFTRVEPEHPTIDGVYGSTWITSGAGSVVLLNGKPGDPIVAFHHIKQPASEVGTFKIIHDHDTGRSKTWHSVDLVLLAKQPGGLTALAAAMAIFETDKPTANEKDKAPQKARQTHRPWLPEDHPTG